MEKKLLREKKLVRKVMVISRPPVTFLLNLLFNHYTVQLVFHPHVPCTVILCLVYNLSQEQKRREMILARELKKPVEDMVLKDSKVRIHFSTKRDSSQMRPSFDS